jgi:hypothetical protein
MSPDDLYDFEDGTLRAMGVDMSEGTLYHGEQREENPNLSATGNLLLVRRNIETRASIETRFNYKFIDMVNSNYNQNIVKYVNTELSSDMLYEPGESMWLEYSSIPRKKDDVTTSAAQALARESTAAKAKNPTSV